MPGTTADGAEEQALLELERGFTAAAKNRDTAFFERHVAKEYVQIVDGKPVEFRAQLADLKSGQMRIDSAELHDMQARVFGDAAILSLAGEATGTKVLASVGRPDQANRPVEAKPVATASAMTSRSACLGSPITALAPAASCWDGRTIHPGPA